MTSWDVGEEVASNNLFLCSTIETKCEKDDLWLWGGLSIGTHKSIMIRTLTPRDLPWAAIYSRGGGGRTKAS